MNSLRRYFVAGLLFWLPIWATYVVIKFLFGLLDSAISFIPAKYQPTQLLGLHIPGLGILFIIIIIFITGLLFSNFIGHRLINIWEKLLSRIPLIRTIYSAIKKVIDAFLQPRSDSFRKVLLVEYPRKGLWSIGFQTSRNFQGTPANISTITVFIPTTPNPTSGFLIIAPVSDTLELDMSVEEAFKMIISIGVVMPEKNVTTHSSIP